MPSARPGRTSVGFRRMLRVAGATSTEVRTEIGLAC
jgi:hypothetical protein